MNNEDEEVSLPADTLKILNEFLQEKAQREQTEIENIQSKAGKDTNFEEDWQLSQFWYSESTKSRLGDVVRQIINGPDYSIALLSCPSLYKTVKNLHENVKIFEYDRRFSAFGDDFVFYDFNDAETKDYLSDHREKYDLIIADPPFLSEECITKISKLICNLRKHNAKIIFCSGEVVEPWLTNLLEGVRKCDFRPQHERNLGNEFASYSNFDLDALIKS